MEQKHKHQEIAELVQEVLEIYGGEAHLGQITKKAIELNPKLFEKSKTPEAEIRDIIQKYSSDSIKYRYTDLFKSVHGVKASKGYWGLRKNNTGNFTQWLEDYKNSFEETTTLVREIEV